MPAETMHPTKGNPKPVVTGKKGNVGGIATAGRHGHMLKGLTALVKPGLATTKTASVSNMPRPEMGNKKPNPGAVKPVAHGVFGRQSSTAGAAKKITSSGHKGIHVGTRPEGAIKRDSASVVKP